MNMFKFNFLLVFSFIFFSNAKSQSNLVSVVASGDGPTESLATNRALRNAIEKTFGVFISSSTQVSNDELIKDEIATIASGNIASYEIISVTNNTTSFFVTVSAQVSPEKVVLNLKSAGKSVELQGNVFAQNVLKEKFYKEQEILTIKDFIEIYKNFWIIDSFSTYPCNPYFTTIDQNERWRFERYLGIGSELGDVGYWQDSDNGIIQALKKNYCFDGLMSNFSSDDTRTNLSYYFPQILRLNDNGSFKKETNWRNNQPNVFGDISGDFYILPIIFKPHYNLKNALIINNAIKKLLNSISITNKDEYTNKLGLTYELTLTTFSKEQLMMGPMTSIKNGSNTIKVPFYETTNKILNNTYSLRNKESVQILRDFFVSQFDRSGISSIKIVNNTSFSKLFHFGLRHNYLKVIARDKGEFYSVDDDTFYATNFRTDLKSIDLNPSSFFGDKRYALYPSVLMLRLSLNDLQNLKEVQFEWKTK